MKLKIQNIRYLFFAIFLFFLEQKLIILPQQIDPNKTILMGVSPNKQEEQKNKEELQQVKLNWEQIPGKMKKIDIARGGKDPLAVGINEFGLPVKLKNDWKTWEPLSKENDITLDVSIGSDGTIAFINEKTKNVYILEDNSYKKNPEKATVISVGSQNEIWVLGGPGIYKTGGTSPFRKKNPLSNLGWHNFANKQGYSISCGGDGTTFLLGEGQIIYKFNKHFYKRIWEPFIRLADIGFSSPWKIKVKDKYSIAFLDYEKQLWKLIPGRKGVKYKDWQKVSGDLRVNDFGIGNDGTIVIIDEKQDVFFAKPLEIDKKTKIEQRGEIVYGNQVVRISTDNFHNYKRVWTHAAGYELVKNINTQSPNNNYELLVNSPKYATVYVKKRVIKWRWAYSFIRRKKVTWENVPTMAIMDDYSTKPVEINDYRQDSGSLFSITHKDKEDSNDPIKYGDIVSIWSLYAVAGFSQHCGILGKERKWCVSKKENPRLPGWKWHNVLVAIITHPQAKDGSQDFIIRSPNGIPNGTIVHKKDIVEIVSLSPYAKNKCIWVDQNSRYGPPFFEVLIFGNKGKNLPDPYGDRSTAGAQLFNIKPINFKENLTEIKEKPFKPGWMREAVPKPREIYKKIKEKFFKIEKSIEEMSKAEKADVTEDLKEGIGVIREIRNYTEYPLDAGNLGIVNPDDTINARERTLYKRLTITGFSIDTEIKDFGPEKMIILDKLWSKGVAWMTESLKAPGQALLMFMAKAEDKGGIQVFFNNKLDPDFIYRVVIGGWDNTKSAIMYKKKSEDGFIEHVMARTDAKANPLAIVSSGRFVPYWISINNGFIMVGTGVPGENMIMSCLINNQEKIDRIGLSSHDAKVEYVEVQIKEPLVIYPDTVLYKNSNEVISSGWIKDKLRVPNEGSVSFSVETEGPVTMVFANTENKEQYKMVFGAIKNSGFQILKNETVVLDIVSEKARIEKGKENKFWVTINGGKILAGQGSHSENIFASWQDQKPIENILNVGFLPKQSTQKISQISFTPPVTIGTSQTKVTYEKKMERSPYRGSLKLIRYFEWVFYQDGQRVGAKDFISGKNFHLFATPQQETKYIVKLEISPRGVPSIIEVEVPHESINQIKIKTKIANKNIDAESSREIAESFQKSGKTMMMGTSPGDSAANWAIIAAGGGLAAAGAGTGALAAKQQADASRAQLELERNYRFAYSPVFTEMADIANGMYNKVPEFAVKNRTEVEGLLRASRGFSFYYDDQFERLLQIYLNVIQFINHPAVVEDTSVKERIYDAIDEFSDKFKPYTVLYPQLMDLFVGAFSNVYLINKDNVNDSYRRDRWYLSMLKISDELLGHSLKNPDYVIKIDPLQGEYLWVPQEITNDCGSIIFDVQGQSDAFVCLAKKDYKVKDDLNKSYEITFGSWDNEKIEIRVKSLGRPAAEVSYEILGEKILDPRKSKSFWISLNKGVINVGQGREVSKNILLTWQDPFPWKGIKNVGFGTWKNPIEIKNIIIDSNFGEKKSAQKVEVPIAVTEKPFEPITPAKTETEQIKVQPEKLQQTPEIIVQEESKLTEDEIRIALKQIESIEEKKEFLKFLTEEKAISSVEPFLNEITVQ